MNVHVNKNEVGKIIKIQQFVKTRWFSLLDLLSHYFNMHTFIKEYSYSNNEFNDNIYSDDDDLTTDKISFSLTFYDFQK